MELAVIGSAMEEATTRVVDTARVTRTSACVCVHTDGSDRAVSSSARVEQRSRVEEEREARAIELDAATATRPTAASNAKRRSAHSIATSMESV